jgi:hypothetical protein
LGRNCRAEVRLWLYARETAAHCFEEAGHDRAKWGTLLIHKLGCACLFKPVRACELNWINLMEMEKLEDRRRPGRPNKLPCARHASLPDSLRRLWAKECLMGSALNSIDAAITASPALESNIKQLGVSGAMIPSKLGQKYESENVTVVLNYGLPMLIKCSHSFTFDRKA